MSQITITPVVNSITVSPTNVAVTIDTGTSLPTGPAGGDLTGTYPNPTIAAGSVSTTKIANGGVKAANIGAGEVSYSKLPNQSVGTLLGRYSAGTGSPEVVNLDASLAIDNIAGTIGLATDAVGTINIANDAVTFDKTQNISTSRILGRTTTGTGNIEQLTASQARGVLGLATTDTPQFAGVTLSNGEFFTNSTDGRVDLGPNGTHPSQPSQDYFALTVDGASWGYGVSLGNRNTRTDVLNTQGSLRFLCTLLIDDSTPLSLGSSQYYSISQRAAGGNGCLTIGAVVNNASSSGAIVFTENNQAGAANRVPTTDHLDPTVYIYGRGSANASDFVRINHNTTDGYIEAGRGIMRITGASGVRIDSTYGFGVTPTAVTTGYTAFTNPTTRRTCDTTTVTLAQLAQIVGTLIEDLKSKGIISA